MCLQCTLLSPLIEVDKSGTASRHAFAFMAQLDHQLGRLHFDMSTQVRSQADSEALAQQYAAVDSTVDLQASIYLKETLELFESNGLEMVTMSVDGDGNCMAMAWQWHGNGMTMKLQIHGDAKALRPNANPDAGPEPFAGTK